MKHLNSVSTEPAAGQIFAIGDVSQRPLARYERQMRLESVPNALEQAKQAAAAICGRQAPHPEIPWFWSDQYDIKLQIAGLPLNCDQVIIRGDSSAGKFAVFHIRGVQIEAVEAVNSPGDFMFGKSAIAKRQPIDCAKLCDASLPIREAAA